MPLFYQQDINLTTRLAVWKIEEEESFFSGRVPLQREITHPHKRLQHLAGRLLLCELFPDFPYDLIRIADTRKPFLEDEQYHFSISHAGDFAAAIVSRDQRVGVDVELRTPKVLKVLHKFLSDPERTLLESPPFGKYPFPKVPLPYLNETLFWSVKETLFKWHGDGGVDFKEHLHLKDMRVRGEDEGEILCAVTLAPEAELVVQYRFFGDLCLSFVNSGTGTDQ